MNLEDVAQQAGVSTATVSRVVNNQGVVRKSTRIRVLKVIEELKYSPNLHARALAGSIRMIGLVVSNLENPFFLDIFHHLEIAAHNQGYEVLIANTCYDRERLQSSVRMMLGRRPSGMAMIVSEMEEGLLDELLERKIRTVVYDVSPPRPGITTIRTNYKRGMQRIVEYLHSLGHRRVAFIGHHPSLGPLSDRQRVFVEVMESYQGGVEYRVATSDDSFAGGRQAVRDLFEGFQPTAIVCVNDFIALGVLRQLRDMGLRVPQDVSVSGFDNITLSEMVYPALTTAHIPRDFIGKQILDGVIGANVLDTNSSKDTLIEPELLVRDSTGPAPV